MTAYHEAGHALVSWFMPHLDPIHRISIIGRSESLGQTETAPEDRVHETKTRIVEQITMALGGRAAESLVFNEMTTGAANDLKRATDLARLMVVEFGMSDLGPIHFDEDQRSFYENRKISESMSAKIDEQVQKITDAAYKQAVAVLKKLSKQLDLLAEELLKKETIESEEFERIIGPKKVILAKVLA